MLTTPAGSRTGGMKFPDQRSLTDQLKDLMAIANREKMYDAADFLRNYLERCSARDSEPARLHSPDIKPGS